MSNTNLSYKIEANIKRLNCNKFCNTQTGEYIHQMQISLVTQNIVIVQTFGGIIYISFVVQNHFNNLSDIMNKIILHHLNEVKDPFLIQLMCS